MKMYEMESVDILGVTYKLEFVPFIDAEEVGLHNGMIELQGMCDIDEKIIFISNTISKTQQIITAKHEVLHAILYECGLFNCSSVPQEGWAVNEEMVDFFALQWDKINNIYEKLGLIEYKDKKIECKSHSKKIDCKSHSEKIEHTSKGKRVEQRGMKVEKG